MITKKNNKLISLLLVGVLVLILMMPVFAGATDAFSLVVGASETFSVTDSTITNITPSDSNIITVNASSGASVIVYGKAVGTATLKVESVKNSSGEKTEKTITVTVTGTGTNPTTTLPTVTIAVGQTSTIGTFSALNSYNSSSPNIASVTFMNNTLSVVGITAGNTTITYSQANTNGTVTTYTVPVVVTAATGTGTTPTTPTATANGFNMTVGQIAGTGTFANIAAATSTDELVATVEIKDNKLLITAKGAGSATINYTATSTGSTTASTGSYAIKVTGTAASSTSGSASTRSATSNATGNGIELSSYTRNVKVGKKYKLKGLKLNGTDVAADDLLWVTSDSSIVSVNYKTGVFTIKKTGTAVVIAVSADGKYSRAINLKITK